MVVIKLQKLLDEHERNLNWVSQKTGISYPTLHKLNAGNTTSISFDVLEKLCLLFKIQANELIEIIPKE